MSDGVLSPTSMECSNRYIGVEQEDRVDELVDNLNESFESIECQNGDELKVVDTSKRAKSADWWKND